jgi:putative nucleotidyltransferase with HDIG domain
MLNLEEAEEEFNKYVADFDPNNGRIKLKIEHIKRVAKLSKYIAEKLQLNEEQINLAVLIGYFHDIGRFMQAKIYDTFSDKDSINHAELSYKVLFEDKLIEKFKVEEKYYNIVKKAILNHNKIAIEDGLNDEELLFSKIIRDADKLDIFQIICEYDFESIFWYKDFSVEKINDKIIKDFLNGNCINYKDIKNNADQIVCFYDYIYDLNYKFSLEILKESKYLEEFTARVIQNFKSEEIHFKVNKLLEVAIKYLDKCEQ